MTQPVQPPQWTPATPSVASAQSVPAGWGPPVGSPTGTPVAATYRLPASLSGPGLWISVVRVAGWLGLAAFFVLGIGVFSAIVDLTGSFGYFGYGATTPSYLAAGAAGLACWVTGVFAVAGTMVFADMADDIRQTRQAVTRP